MARVKLKSKEGNKLIGQAIFRAWQKAIQENEGNPVIDRKALIAELSEFLDLTDTSYNKKKIEIDLVFDTDLDENTRLVWISIPTPDAGGGGSYSDWQQWKQDYYDNLSPSDREKKEEELGQAVLFGCGR